MVDDADSPVPTTEADQPYIFVRSEEPSLRPMQVDEDASWTKLVKESAPAAGREAAVDDGVRIDPLTAPAAGTPPQRTPRRTAPPPNQQVHDIAAWLTDADRRRSAGEDIRTPKPIREVLGALAGAPIEQTRIKVLADAAAARHLEGEHSASAQRLNQIASDNDARLRALREHERRTAAATHAAAQTPKDDIAASAEERIARESANDRRVFDAAAAVAMGYVAARGLPAYDRLAQLSDEQLGPLPETPAELAAAPAPGGPSTVDQAKSTLDSIGRGLAQAAGPVAGDDDIAANLAPVNLTQLGEEITNLAASIAPAMNAAMSSHPRTITELLNVEQRPDEESTIAFEQDTELHRQAERDTARAL
ncbi:hypothetical protein [Rhodococcus marinonascens]|uniref:hypothetical protein n=1 Tax=Rhodococcus marinonascens TaxID=38311 RepID=UPI0009337EA1|nr:hypothetical protein [Rhodococcus marinonascens]